MNYNYTRYGAKLLSTQRVLRLAVLPMLKMLKLSLVAGYLALPGVSHALEFGPEGMFSLTGFAEVSLTRANNQCDKCQFDPETDRQRLWADDVVPGRALYSKTRWFTQIQPYLGAKYNLGKGFKVEALLSQRFRDGKVDVKDYWYEKNVAISHDDYGSLRVGHMTTRAWSLTDYPYASAFGLSDAFASTGSGYGMLTNAVRYTSRIFDVAAGDLVLEATYDRGNTEFKVNKPSFVELWAHYGRGALVVDVMIQDARNGQPVAWGHAPFRGPAYSSADDAKIGGSSQSVAMVMTRYKVNPQIELTAGLRRNRWSGAYAAIINPTGPQWNNMFNVDWGGSLNGVDNPGYSATSTDAMLGVRYRFLEKWVAATGMAYLGKAKTDNPLERGQSNTALINTVRLGYEYGNGLQFYGQAGMVHFKQQGLAPLSMPSHAAIQQIDSRVTKSGNWFGVGAVYSF